jgi:hypothetical protein
MSPVPNPLITTWLVKNYGTIEKIIYPYCVKFSTIYAESCIFIAPIHANNLDTKNNPPLDRIGVCINGI